MKFVIVSVEWLLHIKDVGSIYDSSYLYVASIFCFFFFNYKIIIFVIICVQEKCQLF